MKKDIQVFIFGDSIAWGAWDDEKCGWVNRLRLRFRKEYSGDFIIVHNCSVSGDTAERVTKRFAGEFRSRFRHAADEAVIIFAIGINDTQQKYNLNENDFKVRIRKLIKTARELTPHIAFVGITGVEDNASNTQYNNDRIALFDRTLEKVCGQKKVIFVKMGKFQITDYADGIHPNALGHEKMAGKIFNEIKPLIHSGDREV